MKKLSSLYINGVWKDAAQADTSPVFNPANGEVVAELAHATPADLDEALQAAETAFARWRQVSAFDRYKLLRRAASLLRERAEAIAELITLEQGKPLAEARFEASSSADHIDWYAEESRRAYGRVIPSRAPDVQQWVLAEPVGPVAAFSPWNFPVAQAVRKIAGALAAGCSIIIKAPEETPSACIALVQCFHDAGLPAGVLNLVFGVPAQISSHLIASPIVRKLSFTGSTVVGKLLGAMAAQHVKRSTLELGGHAPLIVFEDADVDAAARLAAAMKFRNAGQICASPSRFFVHEAVHDRFADAFVAAAGALKVGDGFDAAHQMGPLANARRVTAMERFVDNAQAGGAKLRLGGRRIGSRGFFFEPTVLTDLAPDARVLSEEPFGPVAPILPFSSFEQVVREANRLPYGLAAYAFTGASKTAAAIAGALEAGMVSINHFGLALPETPFGGIKESGFGSEGGSEGLASYLSTKFVSQLG